MRATLVVVAVVSAWAARAAAAPFAYFGELGVYTTATRLDLATNESVRVPAVPMTVAGTLDGRRGYATGGFEDIVTVVDFETGTMVTTIPVPGNPNGVAVTPDGTKVYVGVQNGVAVIDTASNTVLRTIDLSFFQTYDVVVNHAGTRVYVGMFDGTTGGAVAVINTATDAVVASILVSTDNSTGIPWSLAIDRTDSFMYVPILDHPEVRIVNLGINLAVDTVSLCTGGCTTGYGTAVNPAGDRLYVSLIEQQQVAVFDLPSKTEIDRLSFTNLPAGLDVTPDGTRLYVVNRNPTASLSIVDTASDGILGTVLFVGEYPLSFGHFIVPGPTTTTSTTTSVTVSTSTSTTSTTILPTVPVRGAPALRCQDAIAGSWKRFVPKAHRLLAACFHHMLADVASGAGTTNATATCRNTLDPTASSLARSRANVRAQVLGACVGVAPADVGTPCGPAADMAALVDCVLDAQVASVARAAAAEHADACAIGTIAGIAPAFPGLCGP